MSDAETVPAPAPPGLADLWRALRSPMIVLGLGILVWGLAFRQEIAAAVWIWDTSTAYSHWEVGSGSLPSKLSPSASPTLRV